MIPACASGENHGGVSVRMDNPVGNVLASLPKLPVDTEERRAGYLSRLRGLSDMLSTAAQRHEDGARPRCGVGGNREHRG